MAETFKIYKGPSLPEMEENGVPEGSWIVCLLLIFVFAFCCLLCGCTSTRHTSKSTNDEQITAKTSQTKTAVNVDSLVRTFALSCDTIDYWVEYFQNDTAEPVIHAEGMVEDSTVTGGYVKPSPVARSHLRCVGLKAARSESDVVKTEAVEVADSAVDRIMKTKSDESEARASPHVWIVIIVIGIILGASILAFKFK